MSPFTNDPKPLVRVNFPGPMAHNGKVEMMIDGEWVDVSHLVRAAKVEGEVGGMVEVTLTMLMGKVEALEGRLRDIILIDSETGAPREVTSIADDTRRYKPPLA